MDWRASTRPAWSGSSRPRRRPPPNTRGIRGEGRSPAQPTPGHPGIPTLTPAPLPWVEGGRLATGRAISTQCVRASATPAPTATMRGDDRHCPRPAAGRPRPGVRPQRGAGVRPAGFRRGRRRGAAGPGQQWQRQDHPAAGAGRAAARRLRPGADPGQARRPRPARPRRGLPGPPAGAKGRADGAGEPRLPVRPARPPRGPADRGRAGDHRHGRLRGRPRPAAVGRAEEARDPGPHVAVTGAAVAAGRAVRQPRPGRHQPGQPHGLGALAGRRRHPAHHPRRVRRAAGAHAHADAGRPGMSAAPGLRQSARALLLRDLRLVWRRRGDALQPALFALLVVVMFALAMGGGREVLRDHVAPYAIWVAVLLAGLLSLDSLFRGDAEDGSLEQWLLAPVPLPWLVAVRTFGHWLTTTVPLLLVVPVLGEFLYLPRAQLPILMLTLLLGTPILSLLGAVVAALTVGLKRSGILVALLALPLYVPVLVFGAGSVAAAAQGLDPTGALLLMGAGLVASTVLAPLAAAAAIRIAQG